MTVLPGAGGAMEGVIDGENITGSRGDVLMKLKMDWNGNNREGKLVTGGGS